ncbi:putative para-aminobenzoic acid synthetase [Lyophyllum shimeji]|uniref:Para-aminobenzoic acid synthetase n=1 Tax=Lyophyllum shimeji TaxID=47721 RepID=A0A9P3UM12_LYOSH|nr:putative para-aminobenzoic acid synthetase [Lyophyllum shimeji]
MILPSPSEIQAKLDAPPAISPTLGLVTPPPPVHPAVQYGVLGSAASPPGYQSTRKPLTSITYTFWPQTTPSNSMILAPPLDLENPGPSYCISVNMNCFTPSSYVTTIRRDSWDGEFVGDFEMGLTTSKKSSSSWTWKTPELDKSVHLYWDDSAAAGVITCFSSKDRTTGNVLARFIPPAHPRRHGRPAEMHRLEVSPQGHEYFDDILMSALIVERLRTTPSI